MDRIFDFEVKPKSMQVCGGPKVPNMNAIMRMDTEEVLAVVSDRYNIVKHADVVDYFEGALNSIGGNFLNREIVTHLPFNGARMHRVYTFPDISFEMGNDHVTGDVDIINLTLELMNSYDGTTKVGFKYGAYRLVCTNGLIVGERFRTLMKKHFSSFDIYEIVDQVAEAFEVFERNTEIWKEWRNTPILDAENFLEKSKAPKKVIKAILERYTLEEQNKWGLFQATTYVISHDIVPRKHKENVRINQLKIEDGFTPVFYK